MRFLDKMFDLICDDVTSELCKLCKVLQTLTLSVQFIHQKVVEVLSSFTQSIFHCWLVVSSESPPPHHHHQPTQIVHSQTHWLPSYVSSDFSLQNFVTHLTFHESLCAAPKLLCHLGHFLFVVCSLQADFLSEVYFLVCISVCLSYQDCWCQDVKEWETSV